jgi:predicted metal-dependent hydrolase
MNHKLKIGLILENEYVNSHLKELIEWVSNQNEMEISHYLVADNVPNTQSSKIKKLFSLSFIKKYLNSYLKKLIMRYEEKRNLSNSRLHSNILNKFKITEFEINKFVYSAQYSKNGISIVLEEDSLKELKKLNLDVLLRFNKRILRGGILNLNKFGILSLHLGDDMKYRGGPSGFWEVYNKEPNSGFIIQQLTENLDNGNLLFRGQISTEKTWLLNRAELNLRSYFYLKQTLKKIATNQKLPNFIKNVPYTDKVYRNPTNYQLIKYILMRIQNKLNDLNFNNKNNRYQVGFQKNTWGNLEYRKSIFIENEEGTFNADPFVIEKDNKNFCFVECFNYSEKKAKINVYELSEKGYVFLGTALEESFHLSFPYIFEFNNEIYMVPESSKNRDIRLYKCQNFPLDWRLQEVLIDNIDAADSMIFQKDNKWWLMTNEDPLSLNNHNYQMNLYYSENLLDGEWISHKNNPIIMDSNKARNAGLVFDGSDVFRVSQAFGFYKKYGENFSLNKIEMLDTNNYLETMFSVHRKFFDKRILGSHHLHSNNIFSVFDIWKKT